MRQPQHSPHVQSYNLFATRLTFSRLFLNYLMEGVDFSDDK